MQTGRCPAQPGGGPASRLHRRWARRFGAGLAVAAVALSAAACGGSSSSGTASSAKPVSSPSQAATAHGPWQLVAPVQAAGLPLDQVAESSGAYDQNEPSVPTVNKELKSAGRATAGVFGIYRLKAASLNQAPDLVIFSGYNGTFSPQGVISKDESLMAGAKVTTVAPGPHGGSAFCASSGSGSSAQGACVWATATTYASLLETGAGTKAVNSLPGLMVKMRSDLEVPAGTAPSAKPGQLLVRASGNGNGNTPPFVASTDELKVRYSFKCGAAALNYGDFDATLTPNQGGADAPTASIAILAGKGKTATKTVDAPLGGSEYHIAIMSECSWSIVVRTG